MTASPDPNETEYVGPDTILIPLRDLPPICEKCGEFYGSCEHHPMQAHFKMMTKDELKKLYADDKVNDLGKWDSEAIERLSNPPSCPRTTR